MLLGGIKRMIVKKYVFLILINPLTPLSLMSDNFTRQPGNPRE